MCIYLHCTLISSEERLFWLKNREIFQFRTSTLARPIVKFICFFCLSRCRHYASFLQTSYCVWWLLCCFGLRPRGLLELTLISFLQSSHQLSLQLQMCLDLDLILPLSLELWWLPLSVWKKNHLPFSHRHILVANNISIFCSLFSKHWSRGQVKLIVVKRQKVELSATHRPIDCSATRQNLTF